MKNNFNSPFSVVEKGIVEKIYLGLIKVEEEEGDLRIIEEKEVELPLSPILLYLSIVVSKNFNCSVKDIAVKVAFSGSIDASEYDVLKLLESAAMERNHGGTWAPEFTGAHEAKNFVVVRTSKIMEFLVIKGISATEFWQGFLEFYGSEKPAVTLDRFFGKEAKAKKPFTLTREAVVNSPGRLVSPVDVVILPYDYKGNDGLGLVYDPENRIAPTAQVRYVNITTATINKVVDRAVVKEGEVKNSLFVSKGLVVKHKGALGFMKKLGCLYTGNPVIFMFDGMNKVHDLELGEDSYALIRNTNMWINDEDHEARVGRFKIPHTASLAINFGQWPRFRERYEFAQKLVSDLMSDDPDVVDSAGKALIEYTGAVLDDEEEDDEIRLEDNGIRSTIESFLKMGLKFDAELVRLSADLISKAFRMSLWAKGISSYVIVDTSLSPGEIAISKRAVKALERAIDGEIKLGLGDQFYFAGNPVINKKMYLKGTLVRWTKDVTGFDIPVICVNQEDWYAMMRDNDGDKTTVIPVKEVGEIPQQETFEYESTLDVNDKAKRKEGLSFDCKTTRDDISSRLFCKNMVGFSYSLLEAGYLAEEITSKPLNDLVGSFEETHPKVYLEGVYQKSLEYKHSIDFHGRVSIETTLENISSTTGFWFAGKVRKAFNLLFGRKAKIGDFLSYMASIKRDVKEIGSLIPIMKNLWESEKLEGSPGAISRFLENSTPVWVWKKYGHLVHISIDFLAHNYGLISQDLKGGNYQKYLGEIFRESFRNSSMGRVVLNAQKRLLKLYTIEERNEVKHFVPANNNHKVVKANNAILGIYDENGIVIPMKETAVYKAAAEFIRNNKPSDRGVKFFGAKIHFYQKVIKAGHLEIEGGQMVSNARARMFEIFGEKTLQNEGKEKEDWIIDPRVVRDFIGGMLYFNSNSLLRQFKIRPNFELGKFEPCSLGLKILRKEPKYERMLQVAPRYFLMLLPTEFGKAFVDSIKKEKGIIDTAAAVYDMPKDIKGGQQ